MQDEVMGQPLHHPPAHDMTRLIRNPHKRRFPLSTCITGATSEALEEAAVHHNISLSQLAARILAAACAAGIPANASEFESTYPLNHDLQS